MSVTNAERIIESERFRRPLISWQATSGNEASRHACETERQPVLYETHQELKDTRMSRNEGTKTCRARGGPAPPQQGGVAPPRTHWFLVMLAHSKLKPGRPSAPRPRNSRRRSAPPNQQVLVKEMAGSRLGAVEGDVPAIAMKFRNKNEQKMC